MYKPIPVLNTEMLLVTDNMLHFCCNTCSKWIWTFAQTLSLSSYCGLNLKLLLLFNFQENHSKRLSLAWPKAFMTWINALIYAYPFNEKGLNNLNISFLIFWFGFQNIFFNNNFFCTCISNSFYYFFLLLHIWIALGEDTYVTLWK